jgi:hypothetical protein
MLRGTTGDLPSWKFTEDLKFTWRRTRSWDLFPEERAYRET